MRTTIEMAREAGIRDCTCDGTKGCLERFAELVRADERARMAEQPAQQEPVAWMWKDGTITNDPDRADGTWTPLYTSPPAQRTWVGLTDEEHMVLYTKADSGLHDWAKAIEAKLKEKNQ